MSKSELLNLYAFIGIPSSIIVYPNFYGGCSRMDSAYSSSLTSEFGP